MQLRNRTHGNVEPNGNHREHTTLIRDMLSDRSRKAVAIARRAAMKREK